jgi:hypothetical protein
MQQIELSKKTHQERTGYTPTDKQATPINVSTVRM